jgi:hypothetical protein
MARDVTESVSAYQRRKLSDIAGELLKVAADTEPEPVEVWLENSMVRFYPKPISLYEQGYEDDSGLNSDVADEALAGDPNTTAEQPGGEGPATPEVTDETATSSTSSKSKSSKS